MLYKLCCHGDAGCLETKIESFPELTSHILQAVKCGSEYWVPHAVQMSRSSVSGIVKVYLEVFYPSIITEALSGRRLHRVFIQPYRIFVFNEADWSNLVLVKMMPHCGKMFGTDIRKLVR